MSNYYDIPEEELKRKNLDYDFVACLQYNEVPFDLLQVKRVVAVVEGENDGANWHWVVELNDGRFAYLQGGCDYTGWDCKSWATTAFYKTAEEAVQGGAGQEKDDAAKSKLFEQLAQGKSETWREKMDRFFGLRGAV